MKRNCSIIFYDGWLDISPTIINLARVLAETNYEVTIFCRKNKFIISEKNEFSDEVIASVIYFDPPSSHRLGRWLWKLLLLLKLGSLIALIDVVIFFLQIRLYKFRKVRENENKDSLIVGIDTNGAITSWLESIFLNNKNLVFLSLELRKERKFRHFDKLRIFLERVAYRKAKCVLVQDEDRFNTLSKYNKFDHAKVFYLPNSTFKSELQEPNIDNYFRKLFNLDEKTYPYLVVQAGMINDKVFCKELAEAFDGIDLGCALIFHERQRRSLDDPYMLELRALNSNNLFLSLNPLPYKDIHKIYSATNIGIACYRDINENFAQISKASGKLAQYLQNGTPVLMNDIDSLRKLNEEYDFGVVLRDPASSVEMRMALEKIQQNYEYYSNNALICFEKEFDFRLKAAPFLNFLQS